MFSGAAVDTALTLLEPIGLVWMTLILLTGIAFAKRQRAIMAVALALVIFIYLIGATSLPSALLRRLESPFAEVNFHDLPQADAVIVLGGGLSPARTEVAGLHLTKAADRIVMALELMRLGKAPVLVCGGAGIDTAEGAMDEGDLLRRALLERNFPASEIVSLGRCVDTHDEAARTRRLAQTRGWKRFLLVTSANHLPRAIATFRTLDLDVIPAPCNFLAPPRMESGRRLFAAPSVDGFEKISVWMHEQIGWWEYRRRGWIDPAKAFRPGS